MNVKGFAIRSATAVATTGSIAVSALLAGSAWPARAQDGIDGLQAIGKPVPDGINFQPAVTDVARDIVWLDNFLLIVISVISLLVIGLLVVVAIRYNSWSNPTPARFTHNTPLEITWTVVPIIILLVIIPPSLSLLFKQMRIPDADLTIKATGNQWYWTHEYVDHGFEFDSFMLERGQLAEYGYADDEFLLAVDNAVVVPVNRTVVVQVTASDVIHAWTIPAFGVKQDAVPGRLTELWFRVDQEGVYFGQCSELCGKDHSYMPIVVKVVGDDVYEHWLDRMIAEYAEIPRQPGTLTLASD
ncbi:MAG: cytochrome c oxidase subunit II [Paracoccaceae bacterium]|nr:cytochrome c oxidase subunit II [Paracoccaceae bacterium]